MICYCKCFLPGDWWVCEVKTIFWSYYWIWFYFFHSIIFFDLPPQTLMEGNKYWDHTYVICRVGYGNQNINRHVDWTLGYFIIETNAEPLELEHIDTGMIIGNESVTYFSLFAFIFLVMLAGFFIMQWRKPQLKTVYDLEKGHYIVTRIPRWYCYLSPEFFKFNFLHLWRTCKLMCFSCSSETSQKESLCSKATLIFT